VPHEERVRFFGDGDLSGPGGVADAEACFAGTCVDIVEIGTHALLVVNIESVVCGGDVSPLIYLDAKYGSFESRA
jgi:flavin reductase (DIM6/NTAB) family NADH-FMN oxidoreductase RutF